MTRNSTIAELHNATAFHEAVMAFRFAFLDASTSLPSHGPTPRQKNGIWSG